MESHTFFFRGSPVVGCCELGGLNFQTLNSINCLINPKPIGKPLWEGGFGHWNTC